MMKGLPQQWAKCQLNDLLTFVLGGDWGESPEHNDPDYIEVKCIRASEIKNWDIEKGSTAANRKIKRSSLQSRELQENDIIIEISGGGPEQPVGRTLLIDREVLIQSATLPKVCTNFFRFIRPSKEINSNYLNFYLHHFYGSGKVREYQGGSNNLRNLKFNQYVQIEIPIAPRNEQMRIVAKIEELFSELDKGIESLKTAREQLKTYRQAVLKYGFEGKLLRQTSTWGERSVQQITTYVTSGSRGWAKYYTREGDLFIRAQNLKFDRLDLTDVAFIKVPDNAEGTRTRIHQGDILITITGANVTKSALVDRDLGVAYVSQHVALCRPTNEVFPKFLYWFIVTDSAGRKQLNKAAYGAGKPGLNLDNIKSVRLPLPDYSEQIAIVEAIEERLSICEEFDAEIERQIGNATALRQSILKQAFSGKLVPQDQKDEPAAALLERIRAEKIGNNRRRSAA